jgi:radical SAM superfamily enzyme YgiQ (UPF0313 family)
VSGTRHKLVLYNPRAVFYTLPLALVALASALDRRRYEPVIVDGRLDADPVARLVDETRDALALGVSVLTGAPLRDALLVTRAVRRARPDLPVIWGGWHPSLFARECVEQEPAVEVAVSGQGEVTLAELLERLAQGAGLEGCAGAVFRGDHGQVMTNPPRALADLSRFPAHDYGLLPIERYFALKRRRQIDYVSSQGCRFRCSFCADPSVFGRQWTGLDPERVADEAAVLERRYRMEELAFQDETFFTQPARVEAVCQAFLRRGLRFGWTATLRADQGARMGDDLYALARRSGLTRVMVGVESGSQAQLDWMKKDATLEQVGLTAERLARHGLGAIFNFIVGFPGEPREAFDASLALVKRLRRLSPRFETPIFYYRPYPGTPIAEAARASGYVFPATLDGWGDFDYVGARGPWITPEQYRRVERLKFYARHAWGPGGPLRWPLRALARWRCEHDRYAFPVEKAVVERLRPPAPLS